MPRFKIRYADPETGETETEYMEFEDWTSDDGKTHVSAEMWARDYAYAAADKGWHCVTLAPYEKARGTPLGRVLESKMGEGNG